MEKEYLTDINSKMESLKQMRKQAKWYREIFETYSRGIPVARLKDHIQGLKLHRTKISDILRDIRYLGDENIPKIIEKDLFEAVQQKKKRTLKKK